MSAHCYQQISGPSQPCSSPRVHHRAPSMYIQDLRRRDHTWPKGDVTTTVSPRARPACPPVDHPRACSSVVIRSENLNISGIVLVWNCSTSSLPITSTARVFPLDCIAETPLDSNAHCCTPRREVLLFISHGRKLLYTSPRNLQEAGGTRGSTLQ